MSIDLKNEKGRQDYLQEKMDDLLDGINGSYGRELLEELISRLETTINDFNEEVKDLMDQLKDNTEKKEKLLHDIIAGELDISELESPEEETHEMSDWERRLESLGK